jgi:ribonucleoside-triphosphate reductase
MISKDNYAWYFQGLYTEEDELNLDYEIYVIDYIMELQKIFLQFFDKGDPAKNGIPYRFPIVTLNLSKKTSGAIENDEFLNYVTKLDISRYNIYVSEGNKVSSCCRLLSDLDMVNLAGQVNSFGGGSSISLGSHRVVTINLNRIALEADTKEKFFSILDKRIEDTAKILAAHKKLLTSTIDKGLQMFMKMGWIDIKKMFSTFGILGGYEAGLTLKNKGIESEDMLKDMLIFFNDKVAEYSKKYSLIGNIEAIPGESMAIRLCNVDKLIYKDKVSYELYSNQFIPLWENASIWERMEEDGKYNKLLTGGSIVHITIGEKVTATQARKIIRYAIVSGCDHFALNTVYSECIEGHVNLGKFTVCPKCSKGIKEYYTRVVGFFTPVSSWNPIRRNWEFDKRTIVSNGDLDKPIEGK